MRNYFLSAFLVLFGVFNVSPTYANPVTDLVESATDPANYFIVGQIKTYYELIDQLDSKKVELQVLDSSNAAQQKKIDQTKIPIAQTQENLEKAELNLKSLQANTDLTPADRERSAALEQEIENLENSLAEKKTELEALEATLNQDLGEGEISKEQALRNDISQLQEELSKSQIRLKSYTESFVKKVVLVVLIWFISIVVKTIVSLIFKRVNFYLTPQRKAFILQLIKLAINLITFIAILLVFFSQLIRALPYFAIFATALAFALRDVILSVIAWLIIGTKDGYKVGHYLHIGTLWGTVVEINPFNTIVRQGGMSGQTGRLLTFPNKKIFEEFLENWSKLYNFTFLKWDFFLEQGSDIEKAEAILLKVLEAEQKKFKETITKKRSQFIKKGLSDDDLQPRIFWEIQANGILLRGKLLVDFDHFFEIRSAVTRAFIIEINKEENIHLRFVNNLLPNAL